MAMEAAADHYATLRVAPDADDECLRLAYLDLMRRYHPDVSGSDGSCETSKAINEAYACLRNPSRRAAYDRGRDRLRSGQSSSSLTPSEYRQAYGAHFGHKFEEELAVETRGWKAVIVGVAILATIASFAATSTVDTPAAAADGAKPMTIVMKARPAPTN